MSSCCCHSHKYHYSLPGPQGPIGPTGATGPTGPTGPTGVTGALVAAAQNAYYTSTVVTAITNGNPIVLNSINPFGSSNSDISYDTTTGVITINTTGVYLFMWSVDAENVTGAAINGILTLVTGATVVAVSGMPIASDATVSLNGSLVTPATAGQTFTLLNASTTTANPPVATNISINPALETTTTAVGGWINVIRLA